MLRDLMILLKKSGELQSFHELFIHGVHRREDCSQVQMMGEEGTRGKNGLGA
jgi:hypothetical protein